MILNPYHKYGLTPKFIIMKKLTALLFFIISTIACTTDDNETTSEYSTTELNANGNTTPPTHDKDWNKNGIKGT